LTATFLAIFLVPLFFVTVLDLFKVKRISRETNSNTESLRDAHA